MQLLLKMGCFNTPKGVPQEAFFVVFCCLLTIYGQKTTKNASCGTPLGVLKHH